MHGPPKKIAFKNENLFLSVCNVIKQFWNIPYLQR